MYSYIQRPIKIQAIQWNGDNLNEIKEFTECDILQEIYENALTGDKPVVDLYIKTKEGSIRACLNDFIIKKCNKFSIMNNNTFNKKYIKE